MRSGETDAARAQLARAAGDLRSMAAARDWQELGRMAGRQLEELEKAFGERFRSPGESARAAEAAGRQALKSDDLSPEGARKMPGAGQGQAVAGRSGQQQAGSAMAQGDRSNAPGPLGGPAGPSGAAQALGAQVRRRLELLAAGKATGEAPGREEIDQATRASRVTVPYEPIVPRASYAPADPLTSDVVPWRSRPLVKTYFQVLGPRGAGGK